MSGWEVGKGARVRFDRLGGDFIENERRKHEAIGVRIAFGNRFCEACRSLKPKGRRPAMKGWKCDDCIKGVKK